MPRSDEDDIDLWAVAQSIWKRRRLVAAVTSIGTIASIIIAFSQPNIYTATSTLMPLDSSSDRLTMALSSLGALGGLATQAGVGMKGSVSDKFIALLKSRTLAENVIAKHDLLPTLFPERWDPRHSTWKEDTFPKFGQERGTPPVAPTAHEAFRQISKMVMTKTDPKTGLVEITVEHHNPQAAAEIANDYVLELNSYLQGNSFTTAKLNTDFLEKQLQTVSNELKTTENTLKCFQEDHKLISLDAQSQATVQAYAALKSQLMIKEMEISRQEKSVSEDDVQLVGLRQDDSQLKEKLTALETGPSSGLVSFKDAPNLGMRFAQLTRELMVHQKVFELITQQYELSKIDETKDTLTFQVIDKAIPPDQKSKPKRLSTIVMTSILSLVLGGAIALIIDRTKRGTNERGHAS